MILGILTNSVGALPADSQLNIPPEDGYDEIKIDVDTKPYNVYPENWKVIPLTGTWKYKSLGEAKEPKPIDLTEKEIGEIVKELPGELGNTELKAKYQWKELTTLAKGNYVFVTQFAVPSDVKLADRSCLVRFWGVSTDSTVYINGKKVFAHLGAWDPFAVDISQYVKPGEKNTLAISAYDGGHKFKSHIYYTTSGIFHDSEVVFTPQVYAARVLVTCDLPANTLSLDCLIASNSREKKQMPITCRITRYGDDKTLWEKKAVQTIQPGGNSVRVEMKLDGVVYWGPDTPQLYEARLYGNNGEMLGKERFGFRDFKAKGDHLYLNGRRIYLPGVMWVGDVTYKNAMRLNTANMEGKNDLEANKKFHKSILKGLKDAGSIIIRPHSGAGYRSRALFEACDELGVLIYDDWNIIKSSGDCDPERIKKIQENWLYHVYNHPSVIMFSFGNERYDTDPAENDFLNAMYDWLKTLDKQGRPICSSSGRISVAIRQSPKVKDKTDVCDDHSYYGMGKGSWLYNYDYFKELKRKINNLYGADQKPLIAFEIIGGVSMWYDKNYIRQWNRIFAGEKTDKKAYVHAVTCSKTDPIGGWAMHPRLAVHWEGFRTRYTDEMRSKKFFAEMSKRQWEIFRQQSDIVCAIGPHVQAKFLEYAYSNKYALMYWKEKYPDLKFKSLAMDIHKKAWQKSPGYYQMKRCYTPEFVYAAWFDRNLISGLGGVKAEIFVVNDTETNNIYTVRILFKDSGNKVLDARTLEFGEINGFGRKTLPYMCRIPRELGTGHYRLETYLFRGQEGKRVNDNYYDVYVINENDLRSGIKTEKKVALYDVAGKLFKGFNLPDTSGILREMGLKHELIDELDDLNKYQVLIIGANSIDTNVINSGGAIRKWVEQGGRLLSFEQNRTGYFPWVSEMTVVSANPTTSAELVDDKHPAFKGLSQENFDTWSQDYKYGVLYSNAINLDESVVAAGATGYQVYPDDVKSILSDVKVGEGIVVLNQFDVTKRYMQDAVATRLCNNLVNYIISDEKGFSVTVSGRKVVRVDPADCVQIDLRPYFNSSFIDEIALDGKGGWDDSGPKNDLRNMVIGKQDLGGIVFDVVDPRSNDDRSCIILKHKTVPWLPTKVEGIKVNNKFHYLFFLHTATYCGGKSGTPHYKFIIHYADGTQEYLVIKQNMHIVDWNITMDNLPASTLAWSGKCELPVSAAVYWTEWKNPKPDTEIASIDFAGEENCVPALIGITGYKKTCEEGWR